MCYPDRYKILKSLGRATRLFFMSINRTHVQAEAYWPIFYIEDGRKRKEGNNLNNWVLWLTFALSWSLNSTHLSGLSAEKTIAVNEAPSLKLQNPERTLLITSQVKVDEHQSSQSVSKCMEQTNQVMMMDTEILVCIREGGREWG